MFDEPTFIRALIERPEDARRFSQIFLPQWLKETEYAPILQTIYDFTKQFGDTPSLKTIRQQLHKSDEDSYNIRYKETIDKLEAIDPDRSEMIYTIDQANNVAIIRSFQELSKSDNFLESQQNYSGSDFVQEIQEWLIRLNSHDEDKTMNLKHAIEYLIQSSEFDSPNKRIPCGVKPIDDWTGGGLRKKQLGIYLAPTGHGKSALLLIMAHKIAMVERKNVWVITNEMVMEEVTERALARIKGIPVDKIIDAPTIAYKGLDRQWREGLDKRLYITEYTRETNTDDLEGELNKLKNLHGWKPDVIILDYMERMRPTARGIKRDKEWGWMGAIAKDLLRMAKKKNILVWTAAQFNREGLSDGDLRMDMAQASIRHLQEATAVVGGRQVDIPNSDMVALKLQALKMRQSKRPGRPVTLKCDLSRMSITNEEIIPEDDEEEYSGSSMTPKQKQKRKRK